MMQIQEIIQTLKLSADGENLGLFNPALELLDILTFGLQQTDVSKGRYPNGNNNWFYFLPQHRVQQI